MAVKIKEFPGEKTGVFNWRHDIFEAFKKLDNPGSYTDKEIEERFKAHRRKIVERMDKGKLSPRWANSYTVIEQDPNGELWMRTRPVKPVCSARLRPGARAATPR